MMSNDIRAKQKPKFVMTTDSKHSLPTARNIFRRESVVMKPNQVWASDITYIPTQEGWLYLAGVMDLCSRTAVGWSMSHTLDRTVALHARIGGNSFGDMCVDNFRVVGIDTRFVARDSDAASGVALITVDQRAENAIVVAPGANRKLTPEDVDRARDMIALNQVQVHCRFSLTLNPLNLIQGQGMETVAHSIKLAALLGTSLVLNPAPVRPISIDPFRQVSVLVPNQHDAARYLPLTPSETEGEGGGVPLLGDVETGSGLNPAVNCRAVEAVGGYCRGNHFGIKRGLCVRGWCI